MGKNVYQDLFFAALTGFIIVFMLLLFVLADSRRTSVKMSEEIELRDSLIHELVMGGGQRQ